MFMVSDLSTSKKILAAAGISEDVRVRDLTSDQEDAIRLKWMQSKLKVTFVVK